MPPPWKTYLEVGCKWKGDAYVLPRFLGYTFDQLNLGIQCFKEKEDLMEMYPFPRVKCNPTIEEEKYMMEELMVRIMCNLF